MRDLYREREYTLGDLVGSRPAFVRDPRRSYGDADVPSYFDFKSANALRRPMVYIGGNDGMLHAIDANSGAEVWAFVPRGHCCQSYTDSRKPLIRRLTSTSWTVRHRLRMRSSMANGGPCSSADSTAAGAVSTPSTSRIPTARPAVGILLELLLVLSQRCRPRTFIRERRRHQAVDRRKVGGAGHLGLQQRQSGRRPRLSVRSRPRFRHRCCTR